jgi:hypothetical protein
MAFLQGDPLPDIKQTTTATTEAPGYFSNYLSGLAQSGQSSLYQPGTFDPASGTGTLKTGQELVAGYDPMQTSGYGQFESAAGAYKPALQTAQQNLQQGTDISSADINKFMNPYTQNVTDEMARLTQQNLQRNLLPTMKAGFVGSGALGSQRYASALGQSMADVQSNLTGQQYGALSSGYKQALDAAMQEAGLQQKSAGLGADMAAQEQALGLGGAQALTKAGAERQAYQQSIMDAPLKQASNAAGLMRGYQVPVKTTEQFTGPKAGLYGMSPLQSILGIGSLLGSAQQGSLLGSLGKGISNKLFGPSSGGSTDLGGGITLSYDANGNPIIGGGTDLGTSPSNNSILEDLGYIQDLNGNWTPPED